jgi:hypothetical protein
VSKAQSVGIAVLVIGILVAAFGAAYLVAWMFEVQWLQEILTPRIGLYPSIRRNLLTFPWNIIALASLISLGLVLNKIRKHER